ncbi:hypothetical protein BVY02_00580 [bacterium J17]|nr:hypothetical protein BVY02_00580 [bacterium J17]
MVLDRTEKEFAPVLVEQSAVFVYEISRWTWIVIRRVVGWYDVMSKQSVEGFQFENLPALKRCSVVDSRYSSRKKVVEDLVSSGLFKQVLEAESLANGIVLLTQNDIDVCVIGPSVSYDKVRRFLRRARKVSSGSAFVVVSRANTNRAAAFVESGAHNVIEASYTPEELQASIVRSVVKANSGSVWVKVLSQQKGSSSKRDVLSDVEIPSTSPVSLPEVVKVDKLALTALFKRTIPSLKTIADGYRANKYKLEPSNQPSSKSLDAITTLVAELVEGQAMAKAQKEGVVTFLEAAILKWFVKLALDSEKAATDDLRRQLVNYITRAS